MDNAGRINRRWLVQLVAAQIIASAPLVSRAKPPEPAAAPSPTSPATPTAAPAARAEDHSIQVMLERKLPEVHFDHVALADGIDFLRDVTGLTIDVNWDALKAVGVYRETPVSTRMADVKPLPALRAVLDAAGGKDRKAHLSVEKDRVVVTSLDDYVAHNTEERTYDVRDILSPDWFKGVEGEPRKTRAELVKDLTRLITDTVAPESWAAAGGKPGQIKEKDGQLTITQTKENHQQIANLLDELREAHTRHEQQAPASRPAAPGPGK